MGRRKISVEQLGLLETDSNNQLYWNGKAVVLEQRFTLGVVERWLAALAASATVLSALFPVATHFHWFGW